MSKQERTPTRDRLRKAMQYAFVCGVDAEHIEDFANCEAVCEADLVGDAHDALLAACEGLLPMAVTAVFYQDGFEGGNTSGLERIGAARAAIALGRGEAVPHE